MKSLLIVALLALPGVALANSHTEKDRMMAKKMAAAPMTAEPMAAGPMAAAPSAMPKCTAKVQDSCDQSKTTERNALDHYPADTRDAGNNKMGAAHAMPMSHAMPARHHKPMMRKPKAMTAEPMTAEPAADPAK